MKQVTVAIGDGNQYFLEEMSRAVKKEQGLSLLGSAADGKTLYRMIQKEQPDVVVLDLVMAEMDGFSVLEKLQRDGTLLKKPNMILTAQVHHDQIVREAFALGADYFMLKPFAAQLLPERIKGVAKEPGRSRSCIPSAESSESEKEQLPRIICDYLRNMGIPAHIKGYRYLRTAIELHMKEEMDGGITKVLYPRLAKLYDTTPSRVERAIRHAIEVAWSRGPVGAQDDMFGSTINLRKGRPTNSEFIAMLVSRIRLEYPAVR